MIDPTSVGDHSSHIVRGNNIRQVNSYNYLGVHIDRDLSWHTQVARVCGRIHSVTQFPS